MINKVHAFVAEFSLRTLMQLLPELSPREQVILRLRLARMPQKEIAVQEGCCSNRISQIEAKALRKLRHPSRLNKAFPEADYIQAYKEILAEGLEELTPAVGVWLGRTFYPFHDYSFFAGDVYLNWYRHRENHSHRTMLSIPAKTKFS